MNTATALFTRKSTQLSPKHAHRNPEERIRYWIVSRASELSSTGATATKRPGTDRSTISRWRNAHTERLIISRSSLDGDKLLPFISEQKYNLAIKRIFKAAGLKRLVTVINPTTREEEKRVLYEIASSHLARRTFVGNLYKQVKDPNLVGALSGHKEGSKAFARYRTIDDEMKKELVNLLS